MRTFELSAYHDLSAYTLSLGDPEFRHQYVVDAFALQTANTETKPLAVAFALVGLYLHHERGLSGRQVQRAHMDLVRAKGRLFTPIFPKKRAEMTAIEVMEAEPGVDRDQAIEQWSLAVWESWRGNLTEVADWLNQELRSLKYHPARLG